MSHLDFLVHHGDFGLKTHSYLHVSENKKSNVMILLIFLERSTHIHKTKFLFANEYHREIIKGITKWKIYIRVIT